MKNYIKFILIAIIFLGVSCEKDNSVETYQLGAEFYVSASSYTSLDDEVVVMVDTSFGNLAEVIVTHNGITDVDDNAVAPPKTDLGKIAIVSTKGSILLSDADLGIMEIGWMADLEFEAVIDGKPFVRSHSISVVDPISMEAPEVLHKDTLYHVLFSIEPESAVVSTVTVQTKVSSAGTYEDIVGDFNANDSLGFIGSDYSLGDTIFVKVIGSTDTKSAFSVVEVVVSPDPFSEIEEFELNSEDSVSAILKLTHEMYIGGYHFGFEAVNNTEFVKDTLMDYDIANSLSVMLVDFSDAIVSVDSISSGEVYFYRTALETAGEFDYGVMKVMDIAKPDGDFEKSSVLFERKY